MQNKKVIKLHVLCNSITEHSAQQSDYIFNILLFISLGITCPFVPQPLLPSCVTSFFPQISLHGDKSGFHWGLYWVDSAMGLYNLRGSNVLLISALKEEHTAPRDQSEEWVHYLPPSPQLLKTVSLTYVSIGKRSITYFPESRFKCFFSTSRFLSLWATISLRTV